MEDFLNDIQKNKDEVVNYLEKISSYTFNPFIEKIIADVLTILDRADKDFVRLQVNMALAVLPAALQIKVKKEEGVELTTNFYAVGLGTSGCGKTSVFQLLKNNLIGKPLDKITGLTFDVSAANVQRYAAEIAYKTGQNYEDVLRETQRTLNTLGDCPTFIRGFTPAALEQVRKKAIFFGIGGINITVDEIGYQIKNLQDGSTQLFSLYDSGIIEEDIRKNTKENTRLNVENGCINTNLLFYGTPNILLDSAQNEKVFRDMLAAGLARRSFFAYTDRVDLNLIFRKSIDELLDEKVEAASPKELERISLQIASKCIKEEYLNKIYSMDKETLREFLLYDRACTFRSLGIPETSILNAEMKARPIKMLKLAAIYSFYEDESRDSGKISIKALQHAIKYTEENQKALHIIAKQVPCHEKLADFIYYKFLSNDGEPVYEVDLNELTFFESANKSKQQSYIEYAMAYSYKNNRYIQKSTDDIGNVIYTVESYTETDLNNLIVSASKNIADNFFSTNKCTWDRLKELTQKADLVLCNHLLLSINGEKGKGHRSEQNIINGFNLLFLDVDKGSATIEEVKVILQKYKFFIYSTKSYTREKNSFRIILPLKYTVNLNKSDFTLFMENIYNYLAFNVDRSCKDRSRAWKCYESQVTFENDGALFDPLKFIPKTSENDNYNKRDKDLQIKSMSQVEKFFIEEINQNGNRNNCLFRYQMLLKDNKLDVEEIKNKVLRLNDNLKVPLHLSEIEQTIFKALEK